MIARTWAGWTRPEDADTYESYMKEVALDGYAQIAGNKGVFMLRREDGDRTEFLMVTLWESMDAVKAFAGDEPAVAKFYPRDDQLLADRQLTVPHYEVYGHAGLAPDAQAR